MPSANCPGPRRCRPSRRAWGSASWSAAGVGLGVGVGVGGSVGAAERSARAGSTYGVGAGVLESGVGGRIHRRQPGRHLRRGAGKRRFGPAAGQARRYRRSDDEQSQHRRELPAPLLLRHERAEEAGREAARVGAFVAGQGSRENIAKPLKRTAPDLVGHPSTRVAHLRVRMSHWPRLRATGLDPPKGLRAVSDRAHAGPVARRRPRRSVSSMLSACNWTRVGLLRMSVPCVSRAAT